MKSAGFTLIEIAIVLVVIGLLLSGGLVALGPVVQNAKITQTKNKLDKIEDALVLYAIQNSCLPCPADSADDSGIQQTGAGADIATACAGTTACFSSAQGVVPWVTLGLPKSDVTDEWGTLISYHISQATSSNADITGTPTCDRMQDGTNNASATGFARTGTTFPQGCLNVEDADPGGFNVVSREAAYVLISHGPDTSGGFSSQSPAAARTNPRGAGNTVQNENDDGNCDDTGTQCHQDNAVDVEGNDYFDDVVRWKTGPVIVYECGEGACGNP